MRLINAKQNNKVQAPFNLRGRCC